jgi:hypothetical protein
VPFFESQRGIRVGHVAARFGDVFPNQKHLLLVRILRPLDRDLRKRSHTPNPDGAANHQSTHSHHLFIGKKMEYGAKIA